MTWRASSRSSRRAIERDNEQPSGGAGEGEPVKQAVWTGTINFGLVSIPVKLYPATEPKDVRFHLYDRRTGKRVHYERVTREYESPTFAPEPSTYAPEPTRATEPPSRAPIVERDDGRGKATESRDADRSGLEYAEPAARPIDVGDVVRGIELPSGDLVTVDDEELESLLPERSRTVDIEEFVDLAE